MNWFAVELHCHTLHSDGQFTVDALLENAQKLSLDGIALTDHNTTSGLAELPCCSEVSGEPASGNICAVKGVEWTTFFGHMLVLDCPVYVDWRDALPDTIDEKISEICSNGGVVGIAHPYELGSPMCTGCYWDYHVTGWENVNFIEVWSESFPCIKTLNRRAVDLWSSILDKGYSVAATYGKDWHGKKDETVPCACTYIGTESSILTAADIKSALFRGLTVITMGPLFLLEAMQGEDNHQIGSTIKCGRICFKFSVDLTAREKHWKSFNFNIVTYRLITNGSRVVAELPFEGSMAQLEIVAQTGWYRGELWGSVMGKNCCIAMTSPFYCYT